MFDFSFILKAKSLGIKYLACPYGQTGNQNTCKHELQLPYWHADNVQREDLWSRNPTYIHLSLCVYNLCWRCEITGYFPRKKRQASQAPPPAAIWIPGSPRDTLKRQRSLGFSTIPQSKMAPQWNLATREDWGLKASYQSWQGYRKSVQMSFTDKSCFKNNDQSSISVFKSCFGRILSWSMSLRLSQSTNGKE